MFDISQAELKAGDQNLSDRFSDDGVVVVRGVFNQAEIDDIRDLFTKQVEDDPSFSRIDSHIDKNDILSRYPRFVHPHRAGNKVGQTARHYLVDDRLVDVAARLVGPVWGAQSMFCEPLRAPRSQL